MTRRELLQKLLLSTAACFALPKAAQTLVAKVVRTPLRIDQILVAAFPTAKKALLEDKGRTWVSDELEYAHRMSRVSLRTLGVTAVVPDDYHYVNYRWREYPVQELAIPMIWSVADDQRPQNKKISLVVSLIENAMRSSDYIFLELMGAGTAVASKEYHYSLGPATSLESGGCRAVLYTAVAFLP